MALFERYNELGLERAALKAVIGSNSYINKDRGEFKLYYVSVRKTGNDYIGSWMIGSGDIALTLGLTLHCYEHAVVKYGGQMRELPCVINFFEQEVDCARFIEDYIEPLLLARKMSMGETLILQKN